jgi:murein DD-endopeptidase MepM/ murein hydrolase activator NlpD
MPFFIRLAYTAIIDMVAQARKVSSATLSVGFAVFIIIAAQPGITGQAELHAAVKAGKRVSVEKRQPATAAASQESAPSESREELISTTEQMIERLVMQIDRETEQRLQSRASSGKGISIIATMPSIKPIEGFITSDFGMRMHPIHKQMIFHAGTDFSAPVGTRVMATADGTVEYSGFESGYGKKVIIDHGNGYQTIYAHLSKAVIRQGQHVRQGDTIAFSGNTGVSTGPHLHYEVRKDNMVINPTAFFSDDVTPDKFMTLHDTVPDEDNNS